MTVPQHRPAQPVSRGPRRRAGFATATGLLLALAIPALAGTAHADAPSAGPRPAAVAAEPSSAPSSPVKRPGKNAQPPAPSTARPEASAPPAEGPAVRPEGSAPPAGPAAAPAPSDQKELAHTGSSTTNTAMGVGAGALILTGAGALYAVRRRQQQN
ncbi:LPXTG cell wall anchor domain-containing protein [Streptomyces sp. ASQP_92]|uniref:LPXTG cell wall anchor domain-containing protein n=1 Tax=Streptomyces sp. ASQP_92 TaxID=2979116 RepID=UPI0021BE82B4|nr:LPXTG cell wall anchor domain-containing protein [Streptomyces sp. ASQP_92]MCT9088740.1 LPXTG cell wall anchor domain-containing protein [Streptomyces sp. ASQP_92]